MVPDSDLLLVTSNGFGKRTSLDEFTPHHRGGGGVRALMVTEKTGPVAAARVVREAEELMIISAGGLVIRTAVATISRLGRSAQGVNVMNLNENDRVASISFANGSIKKTEDEGDGRDGADGKTETPTAEAEPSSDDEMTVISASSPDGASVE